MEKSQIHSNIDWTKPGRQEGHLFIPYSYNLAGWANLMLPVFAAHALWRPNERAWITRAMESRDVQRLRDDVELGVRLAESLGLDVGDINLAIV